jgi:protein-S-isoprenylcysteine O-methyltransferase Ste14
MVQVYLLPADLFPSSAAASVFSILFLLWPLSEIVGGEILPLIRRGGARTQGRDRASVLLIFVSIAVSIVIAFSFASFGIALLASWAFYPGVILMGAGIVLRPWSIFVLGRFFSAAVRIQRDQTVVDTGPSRYVRRPSYTGALMIFAGLGLALQSWGAVLALVLIFVVVYGYRKRVEERGPNLGAW